MTFVLITEFEEDADLSNDALNKASENDNVFYEEESDFNSESDSESNSEAELD